MATPKAKAADAAATDFGGIDPEAESLTFGGELGGMLAQARRPQRWFISNPSGDESQVPEGAYVQRGYPVEIAGTVVAVERAATKFGPMPVYVLDVGKGADFPLIRFGLTSMLLRNAHERHSVQAGDVIAAYCSGLRQSRTVNAETGEVQQYEDWSMIVQKGDGTVPVAGVGASADEAPF
jgi:hypothetical protein